MALPFLFKTPTYSIDLSHFKAFEYFFYILCKNVGPKFLSIPIETLNWPV